MINKEFVRMLYKPGTVLSSQGLELLYRLSDDEKTDLIKLFIERIPKERRKTECRQLLNQFFDAWGQVGRLLEETAERTEDGKIKWNKALDNWAKLLNPEAWSGIWKALEED